MNLILFFKIILHITHDLESNKYVKNTYF